MDKRPYVSVTEFYTDKSVFITGGSGYLGKVLIERLLSSCPLVNKVYVLLRDKKGKTAENRLRDMIEQPVFSRLKAERREDLKKLVLVKGELAEANLGMSDEDLQTVKDNVSIVIHCAATIKFNEPLKVALAINVEGTRNILHLAHSLKQLHAFVYVSTAYCNCNRHVIDEVVYPPPTTIDEAYKFLEQDDDDITKFLNGLPNTYAYTKALAENLVSDYHGYLPTVIVRPSIITPAKLKPVPGWVDNWFGATGYFVLFSKGICRAIYTNYDNNIDLIPVDYVCNLILVAAARVKRKNAVDVYNSCTSSTNPISIGRAISLYTKVGIRQRFNNIPYPLFVLYTKHKWLVNLITKLSYIIAFIADMVLSIFGKRPSYGKIISQLMKMQKSLEFFTGQSWLIKSDKASNLYRTLSSKEAEMFNFNTHDIHWESYAELYFKGVYKYLIKKQTPKL